jgi:DNA-binding CsgD family transcriptional regulator
LNQSIVTGVTTLGLHHPRRTTVTALPESPTPSLTHDDALRAGMLRRVRSALDELSALPTVELLVDRAPAALCRVGFDRAMISRVDDSAWVVERFHSAVDPAGGEYITELARSANEQLGPNVIELEMVRRRVALLVPDVSREPRVNPRLAAMTGSSTYVAAPITPATEVVGFFHADRISPFPMTGFDREVVALFAQEFGSLVAAARLRERFEQLRTTMDSLRASLGGMVSGCLDGPVDLTAREVDGPAPTSAPAAALPQVLAAAPEFDRLLSEREREVLRLMALGETNARIARRLVITEGTVKSHVRHILRKLNAANRAEAVCRWLQRPGDGV